MRTKKNSRTLITGTSSGLGKYLLESFDGISWNRDSTDKIKNELKKEGVDSIIHCAFNSSQTVISDNLHDYLDDNLFLTKELLDIPHKKFIFISSVDVYPKDKKVHNENEMIDVNNVHGMYGITKLMSEAQVIKKSPNFLILRCSALLGNYSRKNSLIKILGGIDKVTLSDTSTFNYILHRDVANVIKVAMKQNLQGIYNIASSKNISLKEVESLSGKKATFGNYVYNVGNIDNKKITSVFPAFKKTSREIVVAFSSLGK